MVSDASSHPSRPPLPRDDSEVETAGLSLPIGTVTFLLTDIEGSTRAWERTPAAMGAAVARHYEILDDAIARHQGRRPVEQGEGDSIVAAFARASDAIAAALDAQRVLKNEPWPPDATLRVRMAIHTGDADLRDQGNYFGLTIIRCARLRAVAHGGQVLVSHTTAHLVMDQLPDDAALRDLGVHRLRDLARAEPVWQLLHPELPDAFPPLRSLDMLPNNLPVPLTTFVGRRRELIELRELLASTRLLSLTGAGGCGKTRLALQLTADMLDQFEAGAWFVELATVIEAEGVAAAVAGTLGERALSGDIEALIAARLATQSALLVLDNCEHVLRSVAELVDSLLRRCPQLVVIATTREPLAVPGEVAWRVPSLSLPEDDPVGVEPFSGSDSVQLFLDRAAKARTNFRITPDNAGLIAKICHRLDGIPLAIELAASRLRGMSIEQLSAGLDDRFRLLTGGARTVLPRQQALLASVDWSHDLLTDHEQTVFRRVSVFAVGFTLDAAESVAAGSGIDPIEVLGVLLALVDKSMVMVDDVGRYRLLETLRQYGASRLVASGESVTVRGRHMAWAAALSNAGSVAVTFPRLLEQVRRLVPEADNLRVACEWAIAGGFADEAQSIARQLALCAVNGVGHMDDAITLCSRALAIDGAPTDTRMLTKIWALWLRHNSGSTPTDAEIDELVLGELPNVANVAVRYECLHFSALMHVRAPKRAFELFSEAYAVAAETGDPGVEGQAKAFLASGHGLCGEHDIAEPLARSLLDTVEPGLQIILRLVLAAASFDSGRFSEVREHLAVVEPFKHALPLNMRAVMASLGTAVDIAVGANTAAVRELTDDVLRGAVPRHYGFAVNIAARAHAARALADGDAPQAWAIISENVGAERPIGTFEVLAPIDIQALLALNRIDDAVKVLQEERSWVYASTNSSHRFRHVEALVARATGDVSTALRLHRDLLVLQHEKGWLPSLVHTLEALAGFASDAGSPVEAVRLAGAAQRLRDDLCYVLRWPFEQRLLDAGLTRCRVVLSDDEFEAARGEGLRLEVDAATEYAMRAHGERRRPSHGWASLTPTEARVADLAVQGYTNQQIADQLLMGAETVKTHLSRTYDKLNVRSRNALRGLAPRLPRRPDGRVNRERS